VAVPLDDWEKFDNILEKGELLYARAIAGEISPQEASKQLTFFIQYPQDNSSGK
jgi:hypothetical protein